MIRRLFYEDTLREKGVTPNRFHFLSSCDLDSDPLESSLGGSQAMNSRDCSSYWIDVPLGNFVGGGFDKGCRQSDSSMVAMTILLRLSTIQAGAPVSERML